MTIELISSECHCLMNSINKDGTFLSSLVMVIIRANLECGSNWCKKNGHQKGNKDIGVMNAGGYLLQKPAGKSIQKRRNSLVSKCLQKV